MVCVAVIVVAVMVMFCGRHGIGSFTFTFFPMILAVSHEIGRSPSVVRAVTECVYYRR